MIAYKLIKKIVGKDKFYDLKNYRKFIDLSKSSYKSVMMQGERYNHNLKAYESFIYDACNCLLLEFEIDNKLFSYYIDTLENRAFELDQKLVDEMRIMNSKKYKLNI